MGNLLSRSSSRQVTTDIVQSWIVGLLYSNSFGIVATLIAASLAAYAVTTDAGRLIIAAICILGITAWRPLTVSLVTLIICQEINPKLGQIGLTVLGNEVYYTEVANLPLVFYFLVFAALSAFIRHNSVKARDAGSRKGPLLAISGFLAVIIVISLLDGLNLTSSLGQIGRPLLIFLAAWVISAYSRPESQSRFFVWAVYLAVVALAAAGIPAALSGGGLSLGGQLVYYDTATAAIAAAVLLGVLRVPKQSFVSLIFAAASAAVLVVSFRRSVLLALMVTVLMVGLLSPAFRRVMVRAVLWIFGLLIVGLMTVGSLLATFWDRMVASFQTIGGDGYDESTTGHIDDIAIGLEYALESPWGYGAGARPLPGLFTQGQTLYVHNEILLTWLRFGLIGLVILLLVITIFMLDSARVIFNRSWTYRRMEYAAAYFIPVYLIAAMTAPFMMTTSRWPALLGLVFGVLARAATRVDASLAVGEPMAPWPGTHRSSLRSAGQ